LFLEAETPIRAVTFSLIVISIVLLILYNKKMGQGKDYSPYPI
jgi:hypothetical protein